MPNSTPIGMAANVSASASAQRTGRKRRNNANTSIGKQHHEREIAEIALAEDHVLEGAQVAHAGREVEHALLPAQRAIDVARQEILQHRPRIAVVHEAVIAGIERPHAADEARIVEEHHDQRDRDERERQQRTARPPLRQQQQRRSSADQRQRGLQHLPGAHLGGRIEPHGERWIVADRDAEDAPSGIVRGERAACHVRMPDRRELSGRALP